MLATLNAVPHHQIGSGEMSGMHLNQERIASSVRIRSLDLRRETSHATMLHLRHCMRNSMTF
jgi:hypothetical protein